jgi:aminocarboxymuconate-semialdehyde decarboxylase
LDRGYYAFDECRANISKPPSAYLKDFYYDTVNFDPRALQLAIDFAGVDHLLAGSDYPHQIGSLTSMVESVSKLEIPEEAKALVLGGNAARLLRV